eukprot:gene13439-15838_t
MPKYYCEYCDKYLTHDSPSVRKSHIVGKVHQQAVRLYYQQFEADFHRGLVDSKMKEVGMRQGMPPFMPGGFVPGTGILQNGPGQFPMGFPPGAFPPNMPLPMQFPPGGVPQGGQLPFPGGMPQGGMPQGGGGGGQLPFPPQHNMQFPPGGMPQGGMPQGGGGDFPKQIAAFLAHHRNIGRAAVVVGILGFSKALKAYKKRIPHDCILEIDFTAIEVSSNKPTSLELFFDRSQVYYKDLVDAILEASDDARVKGIICRLPADRAGKATPLVLVQEIRDALLHFKSKGKTSICYTDSFGESFQGLGSYYLASAFSEIYMAPSGMILITGLSADFPFLKGTLEKLGVSAEFLKRKEYKSAANMFIEDSLIDSERESMTSLLTDILEQIYSGIAKERKLTLEEVKELFATGPFNSDKAMVSKLIDSSLYMDEVYKVATEKFGGANKKMNLLYLNKYIELSDLLKQKKNKNVFAFISAEGPIGIGKSKSKFEGSPDIGSDTLIMAIRSAALDPTVKCIILRVDSPGGSYVASDLVHHEIQRAKTLGKKIIVSMGVYAASGGYFISCNADKIVADPATITGSIGVLCGKFNHKEMLEKVGITFDNITINAKEGEDNNATLFSSLHNYNQSNKANLDAMLDYIYEDFTSKVAKGRNLTRDQVEEVAKGRVWTGRQALENGLVDKLGGIREAIELAKDLCAVPADQTPYLVNYPKATFFQQLRGVKARNSEELDKKGVPLGVAIGSTGFVSSIQKIGVIFSLFHTGSSLVPGQILSYLSGIQSSPFSLSMASNVNTNVNM